MSTLRSVDPVFRCITIAATCTALCGVARAAAPLDEPIDVRVHGRMPCTDADDFLRRVRSRTPAARAPRWGESARVFTIAAEPGPAPYRGHLVVDHLDGSQSSRTLEGSSCDEVVDALALIVAVDIDPEAENRALPSASSPAGASAPSREPPPTFTTAAREESATPAPRAPEPWQLRGGVQLDLASGILPVSLVGVPVVLELVHPSRELVAPWFSLGFERTFNATVVGERGDAVLSIAHAFALTCPLGWSMGPLRITPCARLEVGTLNGRALVGKSVVLATPTRRTWAGASLVGRVSAHVVAGVYVELQLGIGVPLVARYELQLDPSLSLGRVGALYWRGALGLQFRFL